MAAYMALTDAEKLEAVKRSKAQMASECAESETKLVEALDQRCAGALRQVRDPAHVEDVKNLARVAAIHYRHARAAAEPAEGDPVYGPLARRVVARARAAARRMASAAARAVVRARATTRSRIRPTLRFRGAWRLKRSARQRRVPARLARISAAGSDDGPGPEPPPSAGPRQGPRLRAGSGLSSVQRRGARARAVDPVGVSPQKLNAPRTRDEGVTAADLSSALRGDVGRCQPSRTPRDTCLRAAPSGDVREAAQGPEPARLARLHRELAIEIAADVFPAEVRR